MPGNVLYIANGWAGLIILPALWASGHLAAIAGIHLLAVWLVTS